MRTASHLIADIVRGKLEALKNFFTSYETRNENHLPGEVHLDKVKAEHSIYLPCYHIPGRQVFEALVLSGFGDRSEKSVE